MLADFADMTARVTVAEAILQEERKAQLHRANLNAGFDRLLQEAMRPGLFRRVLGLGPVPAGKALRNIERSVASRQELNRLHGLLGHYEDRVAKLKDLQESCHEEMVVVHL